MLTFAVAAPTFSRMEQYEELTYGDEITSQSEAARSAARHRAESVFRRMLLVFVVGFLILAIVGYLITKEVGILVLFVLVDVSTVVVSLWGKRLLMRNLGLH
jgi:hypothetical protein